MLHRRLRASVIAPLLVVLLWVFVVRVAAADACTNSTTVPSDEATKAASKVAVLCLVNGLRAERGLKRLKTNFRLARAARFHSHDMVCHKYFGHDGSAGDDLTARLLRVGYFDRRRRGDASEALAWGLDASAQILVDALMSSPEHRSMILDPAARAVGMGLSLGAPAAGVAAPATTLVFDFGDR